MGFLFNTCICYVILLWGTIWSTFLLWWWNMSCSFLYNTDPVLNCSAMSITDEPEKYVFNIESSNQRNLKNITIFVNSTKENRALPFPIGKNKLDLHLKPGIMYHVSVTAEGPGNLWTIEPCSYDHHTGRMKCIWKFILICKNAFLDSYRMVKSIRVDKQYTYWYGSLGLNTCQKPVTFIA